MPFAPPKQSAAIIDHGEEKGRPIPIPIPTIAEQTTAQLRTVAVRQGEG